MTCIIGMTNGKESVMLSDSFGIASSYTKSDLNTPKAFVKSNNEKIKILVGGTNTYRSLQILNYDFTFPDRDTEKYKTDEHYMCSAVVPKLRKCLDDSGYLKIDSNEESADQYFIVIYNNKVFTVQSNFGVTEHTDGFASCGSGTYWANASLKTIISTQYNDDVTNMSLDDMRDAVTKAYEIATYFCVTIGGDARVIDNTEDSDDN